MSARMRCAQVFAIYTLGALAAGTTARADGRATDAYLDQTRDRWEHVAKQIWDMPELGLGQTRSAAALISALEKDGFQVTRGVGGEATAFVATAGQGEPVVAL